MLVEKVSSAKGSCSQVIGSGAGGSVSGGPPNMPLFCVLHIYFGHDEDDLRLEPLPSTANSAKGCWSPDRID